MAYSERYPYVPTFKKKTTKSRKSTERKTSVRSQVMKVVKSMAEEKYFLTDFQALPVNTINDTTTETRYCYRCITLIPQGITDQERLGDSLYLRRIYIRLDLQSPTAATGANQFNFYRVMIVQDHDMDNVPNTAPGGVIATFPPNDFLLAGPSGSVDVVSHYNHDRRKTYTILYDKTYTMVSTAGNPIPLKSHTIVVSKGFRKKLQYVNASTSQHQNAITMLVLGSNAYSATENPLVYAQAKVTFTDS